MVGTLSERSLGPPKKKKNRPQNETTQSCWNLRLTFKNDQQNGKILSASVHATSVNFILLYRRTASAGRKATMDRNPNGWTETLGWEHLDDIMLR